MSDIKLSTEMLAEAARLSDAAVRDMEAAIPELPFGIDAAIDNAIESMRGKVSGNHKAAAISLPLYRQLMRLGALVAIDVMIEAEKGGSDGEN